MLLDLVSLAASPKRFEFTLRPGDIDLETEGIGLASDIAVNGEARKNSAGVEVSGSINGRLNVDCTRCLKPVEIPLDTDFEVNFINEEHAPADKELQLQQADLAADVLAGDQLDLIELAREQILLGLPEQTFCRKDCRGLCPTCGKDLNEGECDCGKDDIDPRWAALKGLKESDKEKVY